MREELTLCLRGSWEEAARPDIGMVNAALGPFGAVLLAVSADEPGELRLLMAVNDDAALFAVGTAVAEVLALPSPRIRFLDDDSPTRGVAGPGYACSCGGVDGDHGQGCPAAAS
ncbi:hypothetical protein [Actinomadura algeriensis]|uniref:Uncharacterized protein n=1 Tax=Actinomadura algeriensis TaxID=1679523 RepID=A0ABR9JYC3_9ACTN|nr:hypothetical protein [Actinomadura algeriensis]MBE1535586.1 hypothetical protein [Actinomadura algeriensis]